VVACTRCLEHRLTALTSVASCSESHYSRCLVTGRYVDKAPRSPGGKLVMMGHGFYMLIMISSYTANLASVLSQKDVSLDFTGWREGSLSVIDRMEDVTLAIPAGMSQTEFIHHEEVAERTKFKRVNCYDSW